MAKDLGVKEKFFLFYLSRPWPQFEATLRDACRQAFEVSEIHSDVKLIKVGAGEIDFREVLGIKREHAN
jgi:hypothetical protein